MMSTMKCEAPVEEINNPVQLRDTEPTPKLRTEKIGEVEVDSGTILILDPCQMSAVDAIDPFQALDGDKPSSEKPGQIYGEPYPDRKPRKIAVISSTGIGDGRYPVFATIVNDPAWGNRVAAIEIWFTPCYCFADDPNTARTIAEAEEDYLRSVNEPEDHTENLGKAGTA